MLYCNILVVSVFFLLGSSLTIIYPSIVYSDETQWLDGASEIKAPLWYCKKVCNRRKKVLSDVAKAPRWSGSVLFLIQPSNDTIYNKKIISGQDSSGSVLITLENDYSIGLSYVA